MEEYNGIHEDMIESHRINKNLTKTGSPGSPKSQKNSKEPTALEMRTKDGRADEYPFVP